jgi:hypothetical protein
MSRKTCAPRASPREGAGDLPGGVRPRGDHFHRSVDDRIGGGDAFAVRQRDRQIGRPDKHPVNSVQGKNPVERIECAAGLDHRDRQGRAIGDAKLRRRIESGDGLGAKRPPAPLAERRVLGGGDEGFCLGDGVDHRRDHRLGAEVEGAAGHGVIADHHPDQRRLAGKRNRADGAHRRNLVVHSVLQIDGYAIEAATGAELGNQRVWNRAPRGGERLAGPQTIGKGRGGHAGGDQVSVRICWIAVCINSSIVRRN